jgi:hypothetical protein
MITRFIARFGTVGVVALLVALFLLGGVGGGLVEHYRLAAQSEQQGEQTGGQSEQQSQQGGGQSGAQESSQENPATSKSRSQQDNGGTQDSQQGQQD